MYRKKKIRLFLILFLMLPYNGFMQQKQPVISSQKIKTIQPPSLKKGDTIAIVAPAGVLKDKEIVIEKAKELLESWGLQVILSEHIFTQKNHFAGTDQERTEDFQKALDNPNIKAIWAARGGYGSVRILDKLDFTAFQKHPKWIVGYSDITAFHSHIHQLGFQTLHAMMASSLQEEEQDISASIATFKKALFGEKLSYKIPASSYNKLGKARGQLVGGNLTLLLTMLGSKSMISTDNKILFIEEIGEYKYHIDRMLQSLKRAGYFENCNGIVVGDLSNVKRNTTSWGQSTEQLILDIVAEYNFPVVFGFPAGHEANNQALILGRNITLTVEKQTTKLSFE
jgi:muramoyltetrapeptide carboxypeptidase